MEVLLVAQRVEAEKAGAAPTAVPVERLVVVEEAARAVVAPAMLP